MVVARGWGAGRLGIVVYWVEFPSGMMKTFWRWTPVTVVQQCEMYLMPLNCTLKNGYDGTCYAMYILRQLKKKKKSEVYLCSEVPSRKRIPYLRQIRLTCKVGIGGPQGPRAVTRTKGEHVLRNVPWEMRGASLHSCSQPDIASQWEGEEWVPNPIFLPHSDILQTSPWPKPPRSQGALELLRRFPEHRAAGRKEGMIRDSRGRDEGQSRGLQTDL